MEDHYEGPIPKRRRKKKLRIGRVIFTIATLCFIASGFYSFVQYNAGKSLAKEMALIRDHFKGDAVDPKYASIENYLLLGVDDDGGGRSRTDTMMVLSWDKSEGKMRVISFMRDIYAEIPGYKSYKLNTAYYLEWRSNNERYDYRHVWYSYSSLCHCRFLTILNRLLILPFRKVLKLM